MNPDGSIFLMDRFITGLISLEVKQRLRVPPQPGHFREAVERAISLTAAIYHGDQILKQKSLAWKMAASTSNPLHTKFTQKNPRGFIQMMDNTGDSAATVQAIRCIKRRNTPMQIVELSENRLLALLQLPRNVPRDRQMEVH